MLKLIRAICFSSILFGCTLSKLDRSSPHKLSIVEIKTINYYPGKNELCSKKKTREYNGKIIRVIEITDAYSTTDKEIYCTIIFKSSSSGNNKFSASKAKCAKLKNRAGYEDVIIDVVDDHICRV